MTMIAALLAARDLAWAEAAVEAIPTGALVSLRLTGGEQTCQFLTGAGSVYDICIFPGAEASDRVGVRLYQEGALLAEGEGLQTVLSQRLSPNTVYSLVLTGIGDVRLEVARHALGRCFDQPLSLDAAGNDYSKAIARSGDVHWYAVDAPEGRAMALAGIPVDPNLGLEARLFDGSGRMLCEAAGTAGGAFLADYTAAEEPCRVRVSAIDGAVGLYTLRAQPLPGGLPEALVLSENALRLNGHETRALQATVEPASAAGALLWESSDSGVARVSQNGEVTGLKAGIAVITAYAAGAVRARCRVEVQQAPVAGIEAITDHIDMNVGDDLSLEWRLLPENASETGVSFSVEPAGVATVDDAGVVRAIAEGEAVILLHTADGGFEDAVELRVRPPQRRWRALLIGEKHYDAAVAATRVGSVNSISGMRSMLEGLSFSGARFEVDTRMDLSRQQALEAVEEAFAGAAEQDVALIYLTCHGYYEGGMTCFQMVDGSVLTAQELRIALDAVPGSLVVLADCCGSGGLIGRASTPADILKGIDAAFGGLTGPSLFSCSRYRVLASASVEQESYRISFDETPEELSMATAFARAACEGCGWSLDRATRSPMRADVNGDSVVTLDELSHYAARRVTWYLSLNAGDYAQSVQSSPEGDVRSLFERTGE